MTYIYRSERSLEYDHKRGGDRYFNIYGRDGDERYYAGDWHWSRAMADHAKNKTTRGFRVLYRVVVRFK